jgi:hypothetical protein
MRKVTMDLSDRCNSVRRQLKVVLIPVRRLGPTLHGQEARHELKAVHYAMVNFLCH